MEWENHLGRNQIQKFEKTVKTKVKLPQLNKKPQARKRFFVQTTFSHSTLKIEQKNSRRKTICFFAPFPVLAWPKSLFQFDFKNHENVRTDLKKRQRLNTIEILWIVKNQEKANNSPSYCCAAIKQQNFTKLWKTTIITAIREFYT